MTVTLKKLAMCLGKVAHRATQLENHTIRIPKFDRILRTSHSESVGI